MSIQTVDCKDAGTIEVVSLGYSFPILKPTGRLTRRER